MDFDDMEKEKLEEVITELENQLMELEEEKEEWKRKAKKIKADFENYKKKESERKENWQDQARKEMGSNVIEALDHLERAMMMADEDSQMLEGVEMVAEQLYSKLENEGIKQIEGKGKEFDPTVHKAVEKRDKGNKVIEEKRKGYLFKDKVLREAEVVVGSEETEN